MALLEISVIPVGKGTSVSKYIAEIIKYLEDQGIRYELCSMGTTVEGDLEKIFYIAKKMHEIPFKMGIHRVVTVIKIDDRKDKKINIEGKIKSVKEKVK